MRTLFVVTVFAAMTGCVDSGREKGMDPLPTSLQHGAYTVGSSTIERNRFDSDMIELYTPGAREVGIYNPVTDRVQVIPANSDISVDFSKVMSIATNAAMPATKRRSVLSPSSTARRTTRSADQGMERKFAVAPTPEVLPQRLELLVLLMHA